MTPSCLYPTLQISSPGVMDHLLVPGKLLKRGLSKTVEAGYRAFWWKKDDVYHFLQVCG